jgi:hypothetical protein
MGDYLADGIRMLVETQEIVQMLLKFGTTQEIKKETKIEVFDGYLLFTHASKGQTLVPLDAVLLLNTVPK